MEELLESKIRETQEYIESLEQELAKCLCELENLYSEKASKK